MMPGPTVPARPASTTVETPLSGLGSGSTIGSQPAAEPLPALPAGTVISEFTIVRPLGRGGSGLVYEALQGSPRRAVALKLLRGFLTDSAWRRFRHEAELLARLRHPGIAQVYAAGMADVAGGTAWIAMELVAGGMPVTTYATAARLDERARIELLGPVCDAVAHAHGRGVIHRDIKPANILVDEAGVARLIDFGIAMPLASEGPATTSPTLLAAGTPQYMSPEQFTLDPADLDVRTDVYSLGLVLYELAARCRPYNVSGGVVGSARTVVECPPGPLAGSVAAPLRRIIAKALEKDRERRYASAAELAAELRRFLAGEAVLAAPGSAGESLVRFVRRHRAASAAAAATAVVIVAAAVAVTWFAIEASQQRDEARRRLAEAEAARGRAEKSTAFMLDTLAALDPGYEGPSLNTADVLMKMAGRSGQADDEPTRAAVLEAIGQGLIGAGRRPDAARLLDEAVALRARLDGEDAEATRAAIAAARAAHAASGHRQETLALWEREYAWHRRNGKGTPRTTAAFLYRMTDGLFTNGGGHDRVLQISKEAWAEGERAATTPSERILNRLAHAKTLNLLRHDDAFRKQVDAALEAVADQGSGISTEDRATILSQAATLVGRLDPARSLGLHSQAMAAAQEAYGPDDRRTLRIRVLHAASLRSTPGAAGPHRELVETLLADHCRVLGPDHADSIGVACELAAALGRQGNHDAATEIWREVLDRRRRLLGPDHLVTISMTLSLARSLAAAGRLAEARSLAEDVAFRRGRLLGHDHRDAAAARAVVDDITGRIAAGLDGLADGL